MLRKSIAVSTCTMWDNFLATIKVKAEEFQNILKSLQKTVNKSDLKFGVAVTRPAAVRA